MPQVRYIGDEPVIVPFIGRAVDVDEVVTVTDEQFAAREWEIPGSWEVISTAPKKSKED